MMIIFLWFANRFVIKPWTESLHGVKGEIFFDKWLVLKNWAEESAIEQRSVLEIKDLCCRAEIC